MNILRKSSILFSTGQLIKFSSMKLLLPFYHAVCNESLPHISNLYTIRDEKLFKEDMSFLCHHFKPVSLKELTGFVTDDKPLPEPVFHLTFDDGLSEVYTVIAPILEEKGIPATFFINTDFLDNKGLFYRYKVSLIIGKLKAEKSYRTKLAELSGVEDSTEGSLVKSLLDLNYKDIPLIDSIAGALEIDFDDFLSTSKPYLTTGQVNDLLNRGFSIGSHSSGHPLFFDINATEQRKQVVESFEFLEKNFHINERYFSFPFSDKGVERSFFEWLYNEQKCKLSFGISGLKHDFTRQHLHRVPFEGTLSPAREIVKAEYLYYMLKSVVGKNHISRK